MYLGGSAEFNSAIENTQGNSLKWRLKFGDEEIIDTISSMRYYGGSNDTDDISIGNTMAAYVDVSVFTDKNINNREFLLECGLELSDGTYEYAPLGYFTVQRPDGDIDEVHFSAYDRMQKFEKVYNSTLTYPTTSDKVLEEICTACGIALATPIANPITITENLKGYTCREVLGYIAGIHGFFACIDRFGELNLRWYSTEPIEKSLKYTWSFNKSQEPYNIDKIELHKDGETVYTSSSGTRTLYHSNPYATQDIADSLYGSLGGYTYTPAEIEILDDIRLDPWDVIKINYFDGIDYLIPAMIIEHDLGGGATTIKAVGKSGTESEYKFNGPVTNYLNRMSADLLLANRVIATKVDAEYVQTHAITTDNLDAIKADIEEAIIVDLSAQFVTAEQLEAETADIEKLIANKVSISELNAEVSKLGYVTANQVSASYATIAQLEATNATVSGKLSASEADIKYADIELANVDVTDVGTLFANVGLITSATIKDGHVTGYLDSVEINANSITAGTLAVDRLVFRGSENSIVYELNNITGALQAVQGDTLNGEILTDRSITVDKIVANSITANEIAAGAITASEIASNAVTATKIATNAITSAKIQAGAITADKLDVDSLSAITADLGTVTAGVIKSADYDSNTGSKILFDLNDGRIYSESREEFAVSGDGCDYEPTYNINTGVIQWGFYNTTNYGVATYELDDGILKLNDTKYTSNGIYLGDKPVLTYPGVEYSIYTPKLNTDKIMCAGEMIIESIVAREIKFTNGTDLKTLSQVVRKLNGGTTSTVNLYDFNSMTTCGDYRINTLANASNSPVTSGTGTLTVEYIGNGYYRKQTLVVNESNVTYIRYGISADNGVTWTWSNWDSYALNSNLKILNNMCTYGGAYNTPVEIGTVGSYKLYRIRKSLSVPANTNDNAWHSIAHGISNVRDIWIDENMSKMVPSTDTAIGFKPNNAMCMTYVTGTAINIKHSITSYNMTADLYLLYTV